MKIGLLYFVEAMARINWLVVLDMFMMIDDPNLTTNFNPQELKRLGMLG